MERDRFKTRTGFIIACIGSAVGMGNIWRFPIMMSQYGGMTFLLVYILFVILIASSSLRTRKPTSRSCFFSFFTPLATRESR